MKKKSSDAKEQWNIWTVPSSPACGPHTMLICRTWKLNFGDMGSEINHTNIGTERQTSLQSVGELCVADGINMVKERLWRKSSWEEHVIDDLVDIVCNDGTWKRKLIYEITKNSSNEVMTKAILTE